MVETVGMEAISFSELPLMRQHSVSSAIRRSSRQKMGRSEELRRCMVQLPKTSSSKSLSEHS
jgi:hypothetical protein